MLVARGADLQMQEADCETMEFIPLHFGDKVDIINPCGRVGVITLWSRTDYVKSAMENLGVDLSSKTSPVAVIGNLYGNGLPHLIRNLLYNPQIRDLVVCGSDLSGSLRELSCYFDLGLEKCVSLGCEVTRIATCERIIDDMVSPDMFSEKPRIHWVGDLKSDESRSALKSFLSDYTPETVADNRRVEIGLPEVEISYFPSEARSQNIVRERPLEAWRELVFRLYRFGRPVSLRKGERQELQNVKVVITKPEEDNPEDLQEYGFAIDALHKYQEEMLRGPLPSDHTYTYGNRIREYYGYDALHTFAKRLVDNPQDRDCYLALWDSGSDLDSDDAPCLVTLFFRYYEGKLTLTATDRTHNALDAWLKNIYGLIKAQEEVARLADMDPGPITVLSHSISIDPSKYDVAERVSNSKGFSLQFDPNGQFVFDIEDGEIVATHMNGDGQVINTYKSKKAERIQHEITRDCAVSDIGHAIYIGRQLSRAEHCLETGEPFTEQ